uniref:Uncharacterized protein n=1 Tax=Arundo donax TaxID=35708 RepID=A0A0A9C0F0_ARUDO
MPAVAYFDRSYTHVDAGIVHSWVDSCCTPIFFCVSWISFNLFFL